MQMNRILPAVLSSFIFTIFATSVFAAPLTSAITYQGNLLDGGIPANGAYDIEFQLWDSLQLGSQVGSTELRNDVNVQDGVFSVELDFNNSSYAGDNLWLQIRVRDGASSGSYTGLLPRQPITPAPYAQYADSVKVTGKISNQPGQPSGSLFGPQTAHWLGFRFRIIENQVNGLGPYDGRLEFSPDNGTTWGTVCDDYFNKNSARVVCRSMGYSDGVVRANSSTTDGVGEIFLDDFACGDDARTFLECRVRSIGSSNCTHPEDVGVTCIP